MRRAPDGVRRRRMSREDDAHSTRGVGVRKVNGRVIETRQPAVSACIDRVFQSDSHYDLWSNMAGSSISASARPDRTGLAMTRHEHAVRRFMLILVSTLQKVHLQINEIGLGLLLMFY